MILLDIVLDGVPPSKNARTRMNTKTGHLYTDGAVRAWMDDVILKVRSVRKRPWQQDEEMRLYVDIRDKRVHTFDLDGALPCLVDAVLSGMLSAEMVGRRPPDEWIMSIAASKDLASVFSLTHVIIETEGD